MPAQVVSFLQRRARSFSRDWSQDELAEFYRVEAALLQSGMRIETDRGTTDEGDPWFAFCRADDGEIFIHFARIDGHYIIAGPAYEGIARGYDFQELVRDLISRHPLVQPTLQRRQSSNLFLHPAALLIAVVGTAFFKTGEAKAADLGDDDQKGERRHITGASPATVPAPSAPTVAGAAYPMAAHVTVDAAQTLALVASAMAAMAPSPSSSQSGAASVPLFDPRTHSEAASAIEPRSANSHYQVALESADSASHAGHIEAAVSRLSAAPENVVGQWLALAAVLQDLPQPKPMQTSEAISSALALFANDPGHHVAAVDVAFVVGELARMSQAPEVKTAAPQAQAAAPPAPAILVVQLTSGALPDVAAIRLVRELGAGVTDEGVVKLNQLPDILAQLIARGEHVDPSLGQLILAGTTAGVEAVTAPPEQPTVTAVPDMVLPELQVVTVPALEAVEAPTLLQPKGPSVDDMVTYFVAHSPKTEVMLAGHGIVIFDTRVVAQYSFAAAAESVTFTFDDGSTISLIGSAGVLHDAGALN